MSLIEAVEGNMAYHPDFGIVKGLSGKYGRAHKMKRTNRKIGSYQYERYTLLRRFEIQNRNKKSEVMWGLAVVREGRRWKPEFDVVVYRGRFQEVEELRM